LAPADARDGARHRRSGAARADRQATRALARVARGAYPERMASNPGRTTRRGLIAGAALAGFAAPAARAQVTDLRGLDPLWRDAEDAIRAFFGNVAFARDGIALELPDWAEAGSAVPLALSIDATMTAADHPVVVHVLAHGNPTPHVFSAWFTPASGRAEVSTRIRLERSQTVTAVARMRDGRHLRADRDVAVSFGACAQIGEGDNDSVFAFQPRPRVSVPAQARRGEIVTIRALISHPMETGLRKSATDEWVRQRIISSFGARQGGIEFFKARLYPAMSTNPYFLFHLRAAASGPIDFKWFDMTGPTYRAQAALAVS